MSDTKPASSPPPMLTVALDLPSAQVLADQASIVSDLRYAVECCKSLLGELDKPEEERDPVVPQALWSAALASYSRCFSKGKRFGLGADDITSLPLEGEVMTFHKWAIEQRTKLTTHSADPFDAAKVGAALARPGQGKRRVEGIAILTPSRVLVDDTGVRQLGALASALAKQTAERAEEQQDTVLEEAQQLDLDHLYRQPPLSSAHPLAEPAQPPRGARPSLTPGVAQADHGRRSHLPHDVRPGRCFVRLGRTFRGKRGRKSPGHTSPASPHQPHLPPPSTGLRCTHELWPAGQPRVLNGRSGGR